jgi:hypothetical protein
MFEQYKSWKIDSKDCPHPRPPYVREKKAFGRMYKMDGGQFLKIALRIRQKPLRKIKPWLPG